MSDTEIRIDELIDIEMGSERMHVTCCVIDRFFCGRNYHPEAVASASSDRTECCPTCIQISDETWCPPQRPTHSHCPMPGPMLGMICPPPTSGH